MFARTWQGVYRVTRYLLSYSKALAIRLHFLASAKPEPCSALHSAYRKRCPDEEQSPLRSRTMKWLFSVFNARNQAVFFACISPNWKNKVSIQYLLGLQEKIVLRKFAPNFYMSAVQCENYFLLLSLPRNRQTYLESVFALSRMEMWQFSTNQGRRTTLISCIDICFRHLLCPNVCISIQVWG